MTNALLLAALWTGAAVGLTRLFRGSRRAELDAEDLRELVGSYVDLTWYDSDGAPQGAAGELVSVELDQDGTWWACLDWGYAVALEADRFEARVAARP